MKILDGEIHGESNWKDSSWVSSILHVKFWCVMLVVLTNSSLKTSQPEESELPKVHPYFQSSGDVHVWCYTSEGNTKNTPLQADFGENKGGVFCISPTRNFLWGLRPQTPNFSRGLRPRTPYFFLGASSPGPKIFSGAPPPNPRFFCEFYLRTKWLFFYSSVFGENYYRLENKKKSDLNLIKNKANVLLVSIENNFHLNE